MGHSWRRAEGNIAQTALEWNPQGQCTRGRPSNTCRQTLDTKLKMGRLTWGDAMRRAQDRDRWLRIVAEALRATF